MGFQCILIKELFDTIFTRYSDTYHVFVNIFADSIVIITEYKCITIVDVLFLHLFLGF